MPRFLKLIYIGGAALAVVALTLGLYEYVIGSQESSSFLGDVALPFVMLVVIVAMYYRRKREMQDRPA